MNFIRGLSCALTIWGLIWGAFIHPCLWLSVAGIVLMIIADNNRNK